MVAHRELRELGYTKEAIRHRVRTRRLHRQARGVYSVGSPHITKYGRLMVAIKRCGPGTVLAYLTAAVLWAIWRREPSRIQVTVPRRKNPQPAGIVVRRRDLDLGATPHHHRLPATIVLQTLIDCAPHRSRREVERMINQADALGLLRADVLHERLRGRTESGATIIRAILDAEAFVLTESELEQAFVPIAIRAGLGKPQTQVEIAGYRVDFYFEEHDLVVEVDGLTYHRTPLEQGRDLEKEHALAKLGLTCRRFSTWQVMKGKQYVESVLRPRPARTPDRPRAA